MEYPLISEYREAILSAEDNFNELASLRPVLDSHSNPVMSSGNFAVVFKMKDENDGKLYAVKCFIKDQEGRDESYRKIADELEVISSSYVLPLRYLEDELFVDSPQCDRDEFPVVVMEWVEGETLDAYLKRHLNDKYELEMLSYRFNRMSAWLLAQPFAHGDLKPDNILVRRDGSLVLVDYDGMFVPSMKGEKSRELGSPDYRHPLRTDADFNEHIDDFSIAVIALSLKAIALNPELKTTSASGDSLLFCEKDYQSPAEFVLLKDIQNLTNDADLSTFLGIFYVALAKNSLEMLSFRLFMTEKPKQPEKSKINIPELVAIDTFCSDEDLAAGIPDEYGVLYSSDGMRLLKYNTNLTLSEYSIKTGTLIICDHAFSWCRNLLIVNIPSSVIVIGANAFAWCESLQDIHLPSSVSSIGDSAFSGCKSLLNVTIPSSVTSIGNSAFSGCKSLLNVTIPSSVTSIGNSVFRYCEGLQDIHLPSSVTSIGNSAFQCCEGLQDIHLPSSVSSIGDSAFSGCKSLLNVTIPSSVTSIGDSVFRYCGALQNIHLPSSVTSIGNSAFQYCECLENINIPESVTSIGTNPFSKCPKLKLTLSNSESFRLVDNMLISSTGILISCLDNSGSITVPISVTSIGCEAFAECKALSCVNIHHNVTSIGNGAFARCDSLFRINVPHTLTYIGDDAFLKCSSLQAISIPDSVTFIGERAFAGCVELRNIKLPNFITSIANGTFYCCSALQSIKIPPSVTKIDMMAFSDCTSLEEVDLSDSVVSIGYMAFYNCRKLLGMCMPSSVQHIGERALPTNCNIVRLL